MSTLTVSPVTQQGHATSGDIRPGVILTIHTADPVHRLTKQVIVVSDLHPVDRSFYTIDADEATRYSPEQIMSGELIPGATERLAPYLGLEPVKDDRWSRYLHCTVEGHSE